jgi:SNF2 family DNA or RNA helicase
LRLQQISCGWFPNDEMTQIPGENPKLEAVRQHCFSTDGSVIVWARFTADINLIAQELSQDHGKENVAIYDGSTPSDKRMEIVSNFQDKKVKILVAHAQAAGRGLTLTACENPIYHSNDFNLELRLQSEDRCHRIGTEKSVTYTDVEAKSTVDRKIINTLRRKKLIADLVTQDPEKLFMDSEQ